jgi:geranylgeranyl diphosphate synthase type II
MNILSLSSHFSEVLFPYKLQVEEAIKEAAVLFGKKTPLKEACEYALLNGGKRFRPALVLLIADCLGNKEKVMPAALAVEFFHTASLIADDLPCMDNDDLRREKPSVHKMYGEATALLASYALIAAGYEQLAVNARQLMKQNPSIQAEKICLLALENSTYNTGIFGATGGQYEDLYPSDFSLHSFKEIIRKKTVSLFEISFVFGWLFGGGKLELLDKVKQAASHFGLAFQIADDIGDVDQDLKNERKVNISLCVGMESALEMFHVEMKAFESLLQELSGPNFDIRLFSYPSPSPSSD